MQTQTETENTDEFQHSIVSKPGEGIVSLAVGIAEMKKRMGLLAQLKREILTDDDFADFNVKQRDGTYKKIKAIKKSGCLKYAVAFNLTTIVTKQEKVWIDEALGQYSWHVVTQCIAPNGRVTEELGVCDNVTDRPNQSEHVIKTMAKTRATSRAIIGMVGTAEAAAEDLTAVHNEAPERKLILCTCEPEKRKASDNVIEKNETFPQIEGCLQCNSCGYPISKIVSESILKQRETS